AFRLLPGRQASGAPLRFERVRFPSGAESARLPVAAPPQGPFGIGFARSPSQCAHDQRIAGKPAARGLTLEPDPVLRPPAAGFSHAPPPTGPAPAASCCVRTQSFAESLPTPRARGPRLPELCRPVGSTMPRPHALGRSAHIPQTRTPGFVPFHAEARRRTLRSRL